MPEAAFFCQMGVVNRDIKLENTLLNGDRRALLKICDFGYSKNEKDSLPKSKVGTPGYTGKPADVLAHQSLCNESRARAIALSYNLESRLASGSAAKDALQWTGSLKGEESKLVCKRSKSF